MRRRALGERRVQVAAPTRRERREDGRAHDRVAQAHVAVDPLDHARVDEVVEFVAADEARVDECGGMGERGDREGAHEVEGALIQPVDDVPRDPPPRAAHGEREREARASDALRPPQGAHAGQQRRGIPGRVGDEDARGALVEVGPAGVERERERLPRPERRKAHARETGERILPAHLRRGDDEPHPRPSQPPGHESEEPAARGIHLVDVVDEQRDVVDPQAAQEGEDVGRRGRDRESIRRPEGEPPREVGGARVDGGEHGAESGQGELALDRVAARDDDGDRRGRGGDLEEMRLAGAGRTRHEQRALVGIPEDGGDATRGRALILRRHGRLSHTDDLRARVASTPWLGTGAAPRRIVPVSAAGIVCRPLRDPTS